MEQNSEPLKNNFTRLQNISLSNIAILAVVLSCLSIDFIFKNWEERDRVIEHDVHWYYSYLPAVFIYNDIEFSKSDYHFGDDYYLFWTTAAPNGKRVTRATMGLAILYAPFFFVADIYSRLSAYPANGFSEPYKMFLLLSAIFYLLIGLDFLKKVLFHYRFSEFVTASVILLLGLGTNLLCYSSQSATMPHVYNFFLFSAFIYCTIKWYRSPSIKNSLLIGLLAGIISLIRPSNAVIALFFIFSGISGFKDLKHRLSLYKEQWLPLLTIIALALLVWLPQLIYWKKITGDYLFYSYGEEHFFWKNPKIMEGLFSFRKGWLVYTPIMGFALIGIFLMKDKLKKFRLPILLFLALNIYIIFSWWCWWYGGTFGQRSMVESYAILALPLASFVKFISGKKLQYTLLFSALALFFIWLNVIQTFQYEFNSLHYEGMTKELYFNQFGKLTRIEDFDKYISWPNYKEAKKGNSCEIPLDANMEESNNTPYSGTLIHLKAYNGKFVCADAAKNNIVIADRDNSWKWETFLLVPLENNQYALRAHTNLFFCAEIESYGEVTATRNQIGHWESFAMEELDSSYVAFKASNDKYLGVGYKDQVFAKSDSIGTKEKFVLLPAQ